jgi:hypothetical protein
MITAFIGDAPLSLECDAFGAETSAKFWMGKEASAALVERANGVRMLSRLVSVLRYATPREVLVIRGRNNMPLHTPSAWTFWLSVVLVVLAIVSMFVDIPFVSKYAFWVAVLGYVVLVIGCTVKTA